MRDARNIILLNIQHRAILYQHITIMNIQDSSFIITQFGTGKCVIRDSAIKHFIKLTLFPIASKSREPQFGHSFTFLWEHFLQKPPLLLFQGFHTLLLEGNLLVIGREKCGDFLLLWESHIWNRNLPKDIHVYVFSITDSYHCFRKPMIDEFA